MIYKVGDFLRHVKDDKRELKVIKVFEDLDTGNTYLLEEMSGIFTGSKHSCTQEHLDDNYRLIVPKTGTDIKYETESNVGFPASEEKPEGKTVFQSGAQSSGQLPRYDLIPRTLLDRLAARFTEGARKYSDHNYRKGFRDEAFVRDRINHLQNHIQAYLQPKTEEEVLDDNLSAIAWAVAFLMEREEWLVMNSFVDSVRDVSCVKLNGENK